MPSTYFYAVQTEPDNQAVSSFRFTSLNKSEMWVTIQGSGTRLVPCYCVPTHPFFGADIKGVGGLLHKDPLHASQEEILHLHV